MGESDKWYTRILFGWKMRLLFFFEIDSEVELMSVLFDAELEEGWKRLRTEFPYRR